MINQIKPIIKAPTPTHRPRVLKGRDNTVQASAFKIQPMTTKIIAKLVFLFVLTYILPSIDELPY